jgi:carbonic anhydrase
MKQNEILQRLKEGNKRFVSDRLDGKLQNSSRREKLTSGQDPYAIILSCADSRVIPELAFDTGLGELFVVRVAGNIANTSSIASIEYAVANIGSPVIVVMGHESCGAVTAAVQGGDNGYNLNHLLGQIYPAVIASKKNADISDIVKKNAKLSVIELKNRSTIISDAIKNGKLTIVSAYYHLDTGTVDFLD